MVYPIIIAILVLIILALSAAVVVLWRRTRRVVFGLDEIAEDAVKSLYHLSRQSPTVSSRDLIRAAELEPSRYATIAAELERRKWAEFDGDGVSITPAGERRALELIRAHRLWERYLADREGLPLTALHDEAMRREHLASPEQVNALARELGDPQFDPHGDPIPSAEGKMPQVDEGTPLTQWPIHRVGRIVHVEDEPPALFSQLAVLGLTPGAQVEVDERMPAQVLVWSGRQRFTLAPAAAERVFVVDAPPTRMPLSEMEVGQAGRVVSVGQGADLADRMRRSGLRSGSEVSAVGVDPLGEPVRYRVNGSADFSLSRTEANQIVMDAGTIREIALPRPPWWIEEWARIQEIFRRYGSWTVARRALVFFGPAFVISVGYMDPGNWGTDIEGGARFGYQLLWVIFAANMMAILLQTLSAKLGIATGKTLPEVCRDHYPRWVAVTLWVTAEIAAIMTDLAEFLGGAVGLNLLFHIPLFPAALLTGVIISLILYLERYGLRNIELVVLALIAIIGFGYMAEMFLVKPPLGAILHGLFVPTLPVGATLVAVGIIGATVMPHNLYLHSALIQSRFQRTDSLQRKRQVFRLAVADSAIALNAALLVNCAILIMAAAAFSGGRMSDYSLESAHQTLTPLLGPAAGAVFAITLLASGLASSTTATMAGQVIMEGFIHHRMNVWLRRGITMLPTLIIIGLGIDPLRILVLSQVALAFQLPFAVIPLVLFTANGKIMGPFVNRRITNILAWGATAIILSLNIILLVQVFSAS